MKLNIENKILIPFVIIFFISLTVLLATSFRNDYKFIMDNQFRYMDDKMDELERRLNYSVYSRINSPLSEQEVMNEIQAVMIANLIILKNENVLLNDTSYAIDWSMVDLKKNLGGTTHYNKGDYLISHAYYQPFGWTLIILEDKKLLLDFFYDSYKYNILTGIIFLTLSLQMTILIASNITKPIQKLVKFCALVANGEYGERVSFKRQDEIGQLGLAFNQMLDQLNASMGELISVKNYNQDILNSIEKGIITFDQNEEIISKNPFAHQILQAFDGFDCESLSLLSIVSQTVFLTHEKQRSMNNLFEFVRGEDGEIKFLDFYTSIMWGENGEIRGFICSFNDITERKRIESRIQRLDRLATVGRLASGVAHEIRNPLTGMRTSIQVLSKRLKEVLTGSNEVMFDRLLKEIDRINKLISDLLDYSKRSENRPESVNAFHHVSDTLALLDNEINSRNITVTIDFDDFDIHFNVDPSQFNQIVLNILKNAMDAVEEKTGLIQIIGRCSEQSSGKAELIIADNGSGIDPDLIGKIFDPFFTTKLNGTGLGLSVVHELVQENDGEIDIKSVNNEGTYIVLRFKTGGTKSE